MMVVVVAVLSVVCVIGLIVKSARVEVTVVAFSAGIEAVYIAVVVLSCFSVQSVEIYHF